MILLARFVRWLDPDHEPACRFDASMADLVDEFRRDRAKDMTDLIEDRRGRRTRLTG